MKTELCDCVSYCGDDPRVHKYEVKPCLSRVRSSELKLSHLNDQLILLKVKQLLDSNLLSDEIVEYLTNSSNLTLPIRE